MYFGENSNEWKRRRMLRRMKQRLKFQHREFQFFLCLNKYQKKIDVLLSNILPSLTCYLIL